MNRDNAQPCVFCEILAGRAPACRVGEPFDRHFNALEGFQEGARTLAGLQEPEALAKTLDLLKGR